MARPYSPEEKANALAQLQMNGGDIRYTSQQLGIPERTLFTWRRQWYAETQRRQSPLPPSPIHHPDFKDEFEAMTYLRQQIMAELLDIAATLREGTLFTSPTQRVHLLSQLLDRLMKLDQHLKPYGPPQTMSMRITWDCGLYIRNHEGYRGPYTPRDLPEGWQETYGPSARLEIYWGDDTFTVLPEGDMSAYLLDVKNFQDEPCELAPDTPEQVVGTWYR